MNNNNALIAPDIKHANTPLSLHTIIINEDYRKRWNIHGNDYVHMVKNGQILNNTLYRVGGFGVDLNDKYFTILKYKEAFYDDSITKNKKEKPHLEARWCIINHDGVEIAEFDSFRSPYLIRNTPIYSINSEYHNAETKEFYCRASKVIESTEFLFLDNPYDDDKLKRGVLKISKKDGSYQLYR